MSNNVNLIKTYKPYLDEIFPVIKSDTSLKGLIKDISHIGNSIDECVVGFDKDDPYYTIEFEKKRNEITGGVFQAFHLIFNRIYQNDSEVGLKNYKTIPPSDDFGVDAIGVNAIGNGVAVQDKFRSNRNSIIEYSDLTKTYVSGYYDFNIETRNENSVWLFTTGIPSNVIIKKFGPVIKVIGYDLIDRKIKGKTNFWEEGWRLLQNIDELSEI